MTDPSYVALDDRGIVTIGGADRHTFLQGLVSNDVHRTSDRLAIYAALLTPQGRYLHDFFILESGEQLLLDAEAARIDDLVRRLRLYKLRSQISLEDARESYQVMAVPDESAAALFGIEDPAPGAARPFAGGVAYVDPRLPAMGMRLALPRASGADALEGLGLHAATRALYDHRRLSLGLPDGSRDMAIEKALLLECGFDELHGVDWAKGCYMGQELTARTKYRGLVKKRLVPVLLDGPLPPPGTPVMAGEREAGEIRSGTDGVALALLRLEHLTPDAGPLTAGETRLTPTRPAWATF